MLAAQDVVAPQPQPYEQVRREIAEKVLDVKIQKAVEEYAEKQRALSADQELQVRARHAPCPGTH